MRLLRLTGLSCLLLGLGLAGLGCSGKAREEEKKHTAENKAKIVGTWEVVKSETDAPEKTGTTWKFTGDGFEDHYIVTIKALTDKKLSVVAKGQKDPLHFVRKGNPPSGKSKRDQVAGRWEPAGGQGGEYWVFNKDGTFEVGPIMVDDGKPTSWVVFTGTFTVYGDKLTGDKLKRTRKGDGKFIREGWGDIGSSYVIKGDKLETQESGTRKTTWTIRTLTDQVLILADEEGKTNEFKKKESAAAAGSKQDMIVGTWEVVKSETGSDPGDTAAFARDGKLKMTATGVGFSVDYTYAVEGDKIKTVPMGKDRGPTLAIRELTATRLVTVDELGKTNEYRKK
jgi:hypothetical protein